MKSRKIPMLSFLLFLALGMAVNLAQGGGDAVLSVFYSPACKKCVEVKKEILPGIEKEFQGRLRIEYYNIQDIENYAFLLGLKEKYKSDIELTVPVFFINGNFINGKADIKNELGRFINQSLAGPKQEEGRIAVDLVSRFKDFRPLAIAGAGMIDGINPCAFTVIVFFVSYLALQGYRRLELMVIGSSFIFSVFLTYLLLGLGIFNFLYQLSGFWILAKIFNISIGIFSIILGILAIYDFLKFRKTQDTESLFLKLPQVLKSRVQALIGARYRKSAESRLNVPAGLRIARLIVGAAFTGFLVSMLEAVCTGQLYLPTIAYILKTTPFKLEAFIYLAVYNIMFVLPLVIILLLAVFGMTSTHFAQFMRRHMLSVKMLMAALFISLGVFLIWIR